MTRRLRALLIGNFKAFADTQRIPLKPITLIFGPNSSGKSSFIHSLALAHEAQFGREKRGSRLDVHHTVIGGSSIDLGGFRQFVHRGQANKRVEWGAELNVAALTRAGDQRLAQLLSPVSTVSLNIAIGIELDDQDRPKPGAEPRVDTIKISCDGADLFRMSRRRTDSHGSTMRLDRLTTEHPVFQQVIKDIVERQTKSKEIRAEDFDGANEAISQLLPELLIRVDQFFPSAIEMPKADGSDLSPQSMLFPISKGNRKDDIAQAVRFVLPQTLNDLIKGLGDAMEDELKKLQYLGPLRSFPPRHLAFAEHEDTNWYAGGGYAWDVVRRDEKVRAAVNAWLGSEKLKTSYKLVIQPMFSLNQLSEPIEKALEKIKLTTSGLPPSRLLDGLIAPLEEAEYEARRDLTSAQMDVHTLNKRKTHCEEEVKELKWIMLAEQAGTIKSRAGTIKSRHEASRIFRNDDINGLMKKLREKEQDLAEISYMLNLANMSVMKAEKQRHSRWELIHRLKGAIDALRNDNKRDEICEEDDKGNNGVSLWDETDRAADLIIDQITNSPIERVSELKLVDLKNNTLVTHRDVGIGITQVLPVLVAAYASSHKLIAMEQPEIHLHPALQAELADVFIDAAIGERQNTFILETHSEHLILRLMRRMRESHQQKETGLPKLTPSDVSVLYVEPDGTRSIVREMPLNELGELVKSWPGGFFEEGLREQFGDA